MVDNGYEWLMGQNLNMINNGYDYDSISYCGELSQSNMISPMLTNVMVDNGWLAMVKE